MWRSIIILLASVESVAKFHLPFVSNFFLKFILWLCLVACEILVPWPGIEPKSSVGEVQSLNHRNTRETPPSLLYIDDLYSLSLLEACCFYWSSQRSHFVLFSICFRFCLFCCSSFLSWYLFDRFQDDPKLSEALFIVQSYFLCFILDSFYF